MKIPFHKTHISDEEIQAVVNTMRSGWLTSGPKTIQFEDNFKDYIGEGR